MEVDGGFNGLFVAVVPKAEVGGGPKDDNVTVPGCDPPDPSADGCPNAETCCVLPNAEGVGFEDWPKAGAVAEFCVLPKTEVVVFWGAPKTEVVLFWGVPNTEAEVFVGVLPNTELVLAGAPKTD